MKYLKTFEQFVNENYNRLNEASNNIKKEWDDIKDEFKKIQNDINKKSNDVIKYKTGDGGTIVIGPMEYYENINKLVSDNDTKKVIGDIKYNIEALKRCIKNFIPELSGDDARSAMFLYKNDISICNNILELNIDNILELYKKRVEFYKLELSKQNQFSKSKLSNASIDNIFTMIEDEYEDEYMETRNKSKKDKLEKAMTDLNLARNLYNKGQIGKAKTIMSNINPGPFLFLKYFQDDIKKEDLDKFKKELSK